MQNKKEFSSLCTRTKNALKTHGVLSVESLSKMDFTKLIKTKHIGRDSLTQIFHLLSRNGYFMLEDDGLADKLFTLISKEERRYNNLCRFIESAEKKIDILESKIDKYKKERESFSDGFSLDEDAKC